MQPKILKALLFFALNAVCLVSFSQLSFIESLKPGVSGFYTGQMSNGNIIVMGADAGVGVFQGDATGFILSYKKVSSQRFRLDNSESAVKTPDDHFIVATHGFDIDSSRYFLGVFRLDSQLSVDKFHYIVVQDQGVTQTSITQTQDSGFIIAGAANYSDAGLITNYIIRLDSGLNILWAKHIVSNNLVANSCIEDNEGNLLIFGAVKGSGAVKTLVAKCDSEGNFVTSKYFQLNNTSQYTVPQNVFADNDSVFVISGDTYTGDGTVKGYATKIGKDFSVKWVKQYPGGGLMLFKAGIDKYGAIGDLFEGTHDPGSFFVMATDTAGVPTWNREVTKPGDYMLRHFGNMLYRDSTFYFTGGTTITNYGTGTLFTKFHIEVQPCYTNIGLLTVESPPVVFTDMDNPPVTAVTDSYADTLSVISDSYTIGVYCNALVPLQLLNFSAQSIGATNQLAWQTTNEINTAYFTIERSRDSRSFEAIGKVASSNTNKMVHDYIFNDELPLHGTNYYRLKMVDRDGQFTYSKTISLNNKNSGFAAIVYPNPVSTSLTLQFNTASQSRVAVEVFDISGRKILSTQCTAAAGQSSRTIDVKHLATGTYMIHVSSSGGDKAVLKFVKR